MKNVDALKQDREEEKQGENTGIDLKTRKDFVKKNVCIGQTATVHYVGVNMESLQ